MSTQETKPGTTENDPAEFLLSNPKCHDRYLMVGNPVNDEVERIGVSTTHLIAHSLVFRDMLAESELADPTAANTHITDVSPATFKLMLRHIYGGNLPTLNDEERMNLALSGIRYKIQRLVEKVAEQLISASEENFFPALIFVTYSVCPTLELEISKIIQEETHKIVYNKKFLGLDENSMLVIVKQDMLSITELELWSHLVRWGTNQVQKCPEKTLRDCLNTVLEHFRVLTLTVKDIVDYLMPDGVLTPEELVDVTYALVKNEPLKSPGLCKNREERGLYFKTTLYFEHKKSIVFGTNLSLKKQSGKRFSTFSIEPYGIVKIDSFTIKNQECAPNSKYNHVYNLACTISVTKSVEGLPVESHKVEIEFSAVFHENITLPIKLKGEEPLILKEPGKYTFSLDFNTPHTVYEIYRAEQVQSSQQMNQVDITFECHNARSLNVKYEDHPHVIGIAYIIP